MSGTHAAGQAVDMSSGDISTSTDLVAHKSPSISKNYLSRSSHTVWSNQSQTPENLSSKVTWDDIIECLLQASSIVHEESKQLHASQVEAARQQAQAVAKKALNLSNYVAKA